METRAAGRPSTPGWTPDVGSGLIVACSLLLAATVVVGRGVAPVAAMLIVLSALVAWHRWILSWQVRSAWSSRACSSSRRTVHPGGQTPDRPGVLSPHGRVRLARVDGLTARRPEQFACGGPHSTGRRPHRRRIALLGRSELRARGAARFGSPQELRRSSSPSLSSSVSSPASSRWFPPSLRSRSSSCPAPRSWRRLRLSSRGLDSTSSTMFGPCFRSCNSKLRTSRFRAHLAIRSHPGDRLADHPIALGVLFAMCLPLGVALARSRSILWSVPTVVTLVGLMATASARRSWLSPPPPSCSCGSDRVTFVRFCLS